ncbi:right-handed parallel beta-helix repeat-containing protein [Alkalimonas sp. MEB108]|uniref:Right-handed parallel beta-helix repeat-containing protein n=1 Tax=Alkalimonas cellulosilytica TaxID=3058395 RepID=A0ABU7J1P3_9GAMM|nr:right-handed parallel beta-helix repeat-containing protein [Alkalimonas sp. MEB108]MEE2000431.1 right-handed parallel beta-helix repeat-containing protein [Alkalimonas sp. MEB108]
MKQLLIAILLLLSVSPAMATWSSARSAGADLPAWVSFDYAEGRFLHVDAQVNADNADGSPERPFASINEALVVARPHDEIIIAPGDYYESLRIRRPHITLRAASLHQARVINPHDDRSTFFALRIDAGAHHTRVIGLDISGGYFYTVSLESAWSQGNPERQGVQHVLLSQNRLHGSGRDVVKLKPMVKQVVIERNEIFNSGQRDASNAEGIDNVNAHYMTVQDNYFHSIATTGVYAKGGARHSLIQRNLIKNVGFAGILVGFDTSPDFFDLDANPEMFEALHTLVQNNIVDGTGASGIGVYAAKDTTILHNTVLNAAQTYHAALFFGNVLHGRRSDGKRPPAEDVRIFGNVFHTKGHHPVLSIRHMHDAQVGALSALKGMPVMGENFYSTSMGAATFHDGRPDSRLFQSATLARWQLHSNSDHSSVSGPITLGSDYSILIGAEQPTVSRQLTEFDFMMRPRQERSAIGAMADD